MQLSNVPSKPASTTSSPRPYGVSGTQAVHNSTGRQSVPELRSLQHAGSDFVQKTGQEEGHQGRTGLRRKGVTRRVVTHQKGLARPADA